MNIVILYTYLKIVRRNRNKFWRDILRMYGNIDIEKAKEYQDIVEEYYPIETIVYGIKNIKQEFIESGRKEIYKRTYKD